MKRVMMIALVLSLFVVPTVSALELTTYGKVSDITGTGEHVDGYSLVEGKSSDNNHTTTFDIENKDLKVIDQEKGDVHDRTKDNATWFGIGVLAPQPGDSLTSACWQVDGSSSCVSAVKDGQNEDYTLWIPFTASEIKDAIHADGEHAVVTKIVKLKWGGQDDNEEKNIQTIYINLHTDSVTLSIDPDHGDAEIAEDAKFGDEERQEAISVYKEAHPDTPIADDLAEESNPNTSDINLLFMVSMLILGVFGVGYTIKKKIN